MLVQIRTAVVFMSQLIHIFSSKYLYFDGDGTAYGKQSPLSNTSIVYVHCITQDIRTRSVSFSCEVDNQTNTGIDIHNTHNVP